MTRLIKSYNGQYPRYFVHGPLVFSPVLEQAISTYSQGNPSAMVGSPLATITENRATFPGEELVVVTAARSWPTGSRERYEDPFGQVVKLMSMM